MKAISIKQPWAKWIADGEKTFEIRSWQTKYRGPLLIVASAKADTDLLKAFPAVVHPTKGTWHDSRYIGDNNDNYYHLGRAIAVVELLDIVPFEPKHEADSFCDYAPGYFAWHMKVIKLIEKPFPVKGQLNIYEVDYKI